MFKRPEVKLPDVTLPKMKLPDIKLPDMDMPSPKMPDVSWTMFSGFRKKDQAEQIESLRELVDQGFCHLTHSKRPKRKFYLKGNKRDT